jgi:hypothetical protein
VNGSVHEKDKNRRKANPTQHAGSGRDDSFLLRFFARVAPAIDAEAIGAKRVLVNATRNL